MFWKALLLAAGAVLSAGTSPAAVLGSAEFFFSAVQFGVTSGDSAVRLSVSHLGDFSCFGGPAPPCLILLDHAVMPAEVGRTFAITAATNTNFSDIAALLTDGIDDEFNFELPGLDPLIPVSLAFQRGSDLDFAGSTVTEVDSPSMVALVPDASAGRSFQSVRS